MRLNISPINAAQVSNSVPSQISDLLKSLNFRGSVKFYDGTCSLKINDKIHIELLYKQVSKTEMQTITDQFDTNTDDALNQSFESKNSRAFT